MSGDPNWPRASAWLAGTHSADPACRLAVLGAPLRLGSITPGRTDLAPAAVRSILDRMSTFDLESDRDLNRIAAIDRAILRLAMHELALQKTPVRSVINEAVKLAKKYSSENSAGFVNGILDAAVTARRPAATRRLPSKPVAEPKSS